VSILHLDSVVHKPIIHASSFVVASIVCALFGTFMVSRSNVNVAVCEASECEPVRQ
jgi:hypothetical protein